MAIASAALHSNSFDGAAVLSTSNTEDTTTDEQQLLKAVAEEKKDAYASNLSSALLGVEDLSNSRVLSYQEKAPAPKGDTVGNLNVLYSAAAAAAGPKGKTQASAKLVARHIPSAPSRILDAPELSDDYYLNLVSWNDLNWLAIALGKTVYLWNAGTGAIEELCTLEDNTTVASVSWIQEGGVHLAVGTSDGYTQLWDVNDGKKLRSMEGHTDRVGSLAWNRHLLLSGSRDTTIIQHDVRIAQHATNTLRTHQQEVCGLAWNPDGNMLASGGNDNLLCLWDASRMNNPKFRLTDHQAAVKALAWSPHERNLLASGAGTADRCIKFWNSSNGAMLNSIDTGSQVCGLLWNPYEKEILSSHGFARCQLSLWKYPSMAKIKDLEGHSNRVLQMALGPTGSVLSAGADETLRFWDVFAPPVASKRGVAASSTGLTTVSHKKSNWTMQIR